MAVICCPDCKREMSDTASACPNCGYPYAQKKEVYRKAVELMKNCTTSDGYLGVAELFHAIPEFQDAENLEKECRKRAGAYYQKEKQREEQERQEKLRQEHERKAKQEQERLRQEQERIRKEQELKQRQEKEEKEAATGSLYGKRCRCLRFASHIARWYCPGICQRVYWLVPPYFSYLTPGGAAAA